MDHLHQESKVNIGPSSGEFNPGLQLEVHYRTGTEYDTEVSHMSEECRKAAIVFGLKFTLTNENVGAQAIETLKQLKEMASFVDPCKTYLEQGLDVSFRHEGLNLWVNVAAPETLTDLDEFRKDMGNVDFSKETFSGRGDWKVTSGVDPAKFLTCTIDDILEKACQFSVQGEGKFDDLDHFLNALLKIAKDIAPVPKEAFAVIQIPTAFKYMNYEFKYDPNVIRNVIKSTGKLEKVQNKVSEFQKLATEFLPQAQMMAPMVLAPYADLLKNVNLGNYELFLMIPRLRVYFRCGLNLLGLNAWFTENFLQNLMQ